MVTGKVFPISLAAFLVGALAGAALGGIGHRAGTASILNQALAKDARDVESRIEILGHLRNGEGEEAIAKLERGMDDVLILFDPVEPFRGLETGTGAALDRAIDEARDYRAEHPWPTGSGDFRAEMVRSLFARDPYGSGG